MLVLLAWKGHITRAGSTGLLALVVLFSGCSYLPHRTASSPAVSLLQSGSPMTWQAEMSCPGCAERWMTLTLLPDGTFRMRERYPNAGSKSDESFYDLGRWSLALGDSNLLTLRGGSQATQQFRLLPDGKLRLLDSYGHEVRSIRDYTMPRLPEVDWIGGPMRLHGLYQNTAGGPIFNECLGGQRWRVASAGASAELAKQFAGLGATQSGPILVSLTGRLALGAEAPGGQRLLTVEQFEQFWPGETCMRGPIAPAKPLLDTRWTLLDIAGLQGKDDIMDIPAHINFRGDNHLTGSTGCNRLRANYLRNGDTLAVSALVTTRISCSINLNAKEAALLKVLQEAQQYRITSNELSLISGKKTLARFIASDMP